MQYYERSVDEAHQVHGLSLTCYESFSFARVAFLEELRNTYVVKKGEDRTRDLVARTILQNGPLSAAELAEALGLTPAGIRRHLELLLADGILVSKEPYRSASVVRGRGRPSKVFILTDLGRERFEHSYDDLAVSALSFMNQREGINLVREFAESRANEIIKRAPTSISAAKSASGKVEAMARYLTQEGYAGSIKSTALGIELCQHHCPIAHVAAKFGDLCDAETEAFSKILGTHVQRLATIARGDGVCTTYVPKISNEVTSRGQKAKLMTTITKGEGSDDE